MFWDHDKARDGLLLLLPRFCVDECTRPEVVRETIIVDQFMFFDFDLIRCLRKVGRRGSQRVDVPGLRDEGEGGHVFCGRLDSGGCSLTEPEGNHQIRVSLGAVPRGEGSWHLKSSSRR